ILVSSMKKLAALALLFIFLFNIGGYSVLYWMADQQASKELQSRLDTGQFSGSQTITIKAPISIPYQSDREYEKVRGEFEYQGQFYKLVKQRVLGDTLYVVCVIDSKKKALSDEMNEFTRKANDASSASQPLKVASSQVQDYSNESAIGLTPLSSGWTVSYHFFDTHSLFIGSTVDPASPPPWC
ncbi:MAG TPA: hypothetical protein VF473_07910, partial [Cyclobacteriaceae bacterium]